MTKLNATGTALVYSTYLGGRAPDGCSGIAVNNQGNAYVTGSTSSPDFPTTPGSIQPEMVIRNGRTSTPRVRRQTERRGVGSRLLDFSGRRGVLPGRLRFRSTTPAMLTSREPPRQPIFQQRRDHFSRRGHPTSPAMNSSGMIASYPRSTRKARLLSTPPISAEPRTIALPISPSMRPGMPWSPARLLLAHFPWSILSVFQRAAAVRFGALMVAMPGLNWITDCQTPESEK